jgi:hypothetical protein
VYSELLAAGDDYEEILYVLFTDKIAVADPWSIERAPLDSAYQRMRAASTQVMLFASEKVGFWAQQYLRLLVPAFAELNEDHAFGPYGWAAVKLGLQGHPNEEFGTPRAAFVGAARTELGLKSGHALWRSLPPSLGLKRAGRKGPSTT